MIHCFPPHNLRGSITVRSGGGGEKRGLTTDQGRSHLSKSGQEKGVSVEKLESD